MKVMITLKTGEQIEGTLTRVYNAFEGEKRYIFNIGHREVRCVQDDDGNYVEYVA